MATTTRIATLGLSACVAALGACSPDQHAGTEPLTARLSTADGTPAATATFDFSDGYAKITVETTTTGVLTPGLHDEHIHAVGKCEPNSVGPDGGPRGDFLSAGDHYQAPGHSGHPASGDLPALQVRQDGAALLVTTTDAVTKDELLAGAGTALMLHDAEHSDDAENRVACGVIGAD
jgi:Cu-Zn family superoxide dismutase